MTELSSTTASAASSASGPQTSPTDTTLEPAQWFDQALFQPWQGELFEPLRWSEFMYGAAVALALVAALYQLTVEFTRRSGFALSHRTRTWTSVGLFVLSFGVYFSFLNPNVRNGDYFDPQELFHSYVGSKYFDELGYQKIYECTAVAELEFDGADSMRGKKIRNLREPNRVERIEHTDILTSRASCTKHFTAERWSAFREDIRYIKSTMDSERWDQLKQQRGYSATPVWTMLSGKIAQLVPAGTQAFKQLAAIDVGLQLGTFGLLIWGFGWEIAALAAVFWGTNAASTFAWTGGAFLKQDWLFLLTASLCLARKHKYGLSGGALVWSGLISLFPLLMFFMGGILGALHWSKHRRLARSHRRFLVGGVLAAALLVPASISATTPDTYADFTRQLQLQRAAPAPQELGLGAILSHGWSSRMRFNHDPALPDPLQDWTMSRTTLGEARAPLKLLVFTFVALALFAYLRRGPPLWVVMPLTLTLVLNLTNISCFYAAAFIAFLPLMRLSRAFAIPWLLTAAASQVIMSHAHWLDDRYVLLSYLWYVTALVPLLILGRPKDTWLRLRRRSAAPRAA